VPVRGGATLLSAGIVRHYNHRMFTLSPIGVVRSGRTAPEDDYWGEAGATIELGPDVPAEALDGIDEYSHAEIFFILDRVSEAATERWARHPRGNPAWPRVGIFAQRAKVRPNRLAATIVRIQQRDGRVLRVAGLDAIDGTPVIDIKPVLREFLPRGEIRQPQWASELMRDYWSPPG
jgi:tRNA-Thr(GGU) m(6)t(6)A37 methyltransferase TsaA